MPSEVSYALAADGVHLAYQVFGSGPPLLFVSDGFVPIDAMDSEPALASALRRLAGTHTIIRYDRRGIGLSDRVQRASLDEWAADAVAVLDAVDVRVASVFAAADAALVAVTLAAGHPDRIDRIVVVNGFARLVAEAPGGVGLDGDLVQSTRHAATMPGRRDPSFDLLALIAPSVTGDARFRQWWDDSGRRGASPGTAASFRATTEEADVRPLLRSVRAPTLVIQRRDNWYAGPEQGRKLAAGLPNGQYMEIDGSDSLWWVGDQQELLGAAEAFLVPGHTGGDTTPFLAVLFTDIVDSTSQAETLGDQRWLELLDHYERLAHSAVDTRGGWVIKSTGDGSLACFPSASDAVHCALDILTRARSIGITLRSAIHAGAVSLHGRDVAGMAVHVAARLLSMAGPDEVAVSAVVRHDTGASVPFTYVGRSAMKGISEPVEVYRTRRLPTPLDPSGPRGASHDR